eukprot:TRINITY_DN5440_c0_g1_i1.p1 TRINITY_DN5440_c0_g1~~TRINITY_DN5440_c0_g1_i1.p1  ORF type:complete len:1381 (-),score=319.70 TRINITY_DN5440_c0_g1_i1:20-4099(-)
MKGGLKKMRSTLRSAADGSESALFERISATSLRQGWMLKLTGRRKHWKRRLIVLEQDRVVYLKREDGDVAGQLMFTHTYTVSEVSASAAAESGAPTPYLIDIVTSAKQWRLCLPTAQEASEWYFAFRTMFLSARQFAEFDRLEKTDQQSECVSNVLAALTTFTGFLSPAIIQAQQSPELQQISNHLLKSAANVGCDVLALAVSHFRPTFSSIHAASNAPLTAPLSIDPISSPTGPNGTAAATALASVSARFSMARSRASIAVSLSHYSVAAPAEPTPEPESRRGSVRKSLAMSASAVKSLFASGTSQPQTITHNTNTLMQGVEDTVEALFNSTEAFVEALRSSSSIWSGSKVGIQLLQNGLLDYLTVAAHSIADAAAPLLMLSDEMMRLWNPDSALAISKAPLLFFSRQSYEDLNPIDAKKRRLDVLLHQQFAVERCRLYCSRENYISEYLEFLRTSLQPENAANNVPLIITGQQGCGKTAFLSHVLAQFACTLQCPAPEVAPKPSGPLQPRSESQAPVAASVFPPIFSTKLAALVAETPHFVVVPYFVDVTATSSSVGPMLIYLMDEIRARLPVPLSRDEELLLAIDERLYNYAHPQSLWDADSVARTLPPDSNLTGGTKKRWYSEQTICASFKRFMHAVGRHCMQHRIRLHLVIDGIDQIQYSPAEWKDAAPAEKPPAPSTASAASLGPATPDFASITQVSMSLADSSGSEDDATSRVSSPSQRSESLSAANAAAGSSPTATTANANPRSAVNIDPLFAWLPTPLPPSITLVATARDDSPVAFLGVALRWPLLKIRTLLGPERDVVIARYCEYDCPGTSSPTKLLQRLSKHQLASLSGARQTRNTLFLRVVMEHLRLVPDGAEKMNETIKTLLQAHTLRELYSKVLSQMEAAHNRSKEKDLAEVVRTALSFICLTDGAADNDMLNFTAITKYKAAQSVAPSVGFLHALRSLVVTAPLDEPLVREEGDPFVSGVYLVPFHSSLRDAVEHRWFPTFDECESQHEEIAEFFQRAIVSSNSVSVSPVTLLSYAVRVVLHYRAAGSWGSLSRSFSDPAVLCGLCESRIYFPILCSSWELLLEQSFDISQCVGLDADTDSPASASEAAAVADILQALGHDNAAISLHFRACNLTERALGPTNLIFANRLLRFGDLLVQAGDPQSAVSLLTRASEVFAANDRLEARQEALFKAVRAAFFSRQDSTAIKLCHTAFAYETELFGRNHYRTALALHLMADLLFCAQLFQLSQIAYQSALAAFASTAFADRTAMIEKQLRGLQGGWALAGQIDEVFLTAAGLMASREDELGPARFETGLSYFRMSLFYFATGVFEDAKRCAAKAKELLGPAHPVMLVTYALSKVAARP